MDIKVFRTIVDSVPWVVAVAAALTLGLAPFTPKPHLVEKLQMLWAGSLRRPLDIFDLCLHAAPWLLLALKVFSSRPWRP